MTTKTNPISAHVRASLKAYVALVLAVATALTGIYADGQIGHILTVVIAVGTAVATWLTPNLGSDTDA
jgi:hypothetical protein